MPFTASEFFDQGVAHYENNEFEQAILNFDLAINLDPDLYSAYHNRALAKCELKQYDSALEDMNLVIQHTAYDAEAYCNRGYILIQSGAPAAALEDLDTAVNINTRYASAFVTRGIAHFRLNHIKKALANFDWAIAADPESTEAFAERAALWNSLGDPMGAIEDYSAAIDRDPENALFYLDRGRLYAQAPGEKMQALADYNCFLSLTTPAAFLTHQNEVFDFYRANPAPFLIRRIHGEFSGFDFHPVINDAREQCRAMQTYLGWLELQQREQRDAFTYHLLLATVNFYMGDPIAAYRMYENIMEDLGNAGLRLSFMGLYYFIESARAFHESYESVLARALEEIREQDEETLSLETPEELYYAGLILFTNDRFVQAEAYFSRADSYLPAAYLHVRTQQALGIEPDKVEANIAKLRARETALDEGQGYGNGFPKRFFNTETSGYFTPFQHYAHYREIENALSIVQPEGKPVAHREIWTAFRWRAEDRIWVEWMLRREELSRLSKQVSAMFRKRRSLEVRNHSDEALRELEDVFSRQLEQDDWAGTLHEKFEDFQRSASLLPDLRNQLSRLISKSGHPETGLLVDYFYLRGNLSGYDAMLMYAYIATVQAPAAPDAVVPEAIEIDRKTADCLFDPLAPADESLTTATAGALVYWLKAYMATAPAADPAAATTALLPADIQSFMQHFLEYLREQREIQGAKEFDAQYPLDGFFEWSKSTISGR